MAKKEYKSRYKNTITKWETIEKNKKIQYEKNNIKQNKSSEDNTVLNRER